MFVVELLDQANLKLKNLLAHGRLIALLRLRSLASLGTSVWVEESRYRNRGGGRFELLDEGGASIEGMMP